MTLTLLPLSMMEKSCSAPVRGETLRSVRTEKMRNLAVACELIFFQGWIMAEFKFRISNEQCPAPHPDGRPKDGDCNHEVNMIRGRGDAHPLLGGEGRGEG